MLPIRRVSSRLDKAPHGVLGYTEAEEGVTLHVETIVIVRRFFLSSKSREAFKHIRRMRHLETRIIATNERNTTALSSDDQQILQSIFSVGICPHIKY